jgi:hypothetical protein
MGTAVSQHPLVDEIVGDAPTSPIAPIQVSQPPTRNKLRTKPQTQQNRFVIIAAGAFVTALLIFAGISMPHRAASSKVKSHGAVATDRFTSETDTGSDKSLFPIIDSGQPNPKDDHAGFVNERDLQRTVTHQPKTSAKLPMNNQGTLGSISPFGDQTWQPPPYSVSNVEVSNPNKPAFDAMEKSSLIYVQKVSPAAAAPVGMNRVAESGLGLGLATGTRLRARLESTASSAVRAPVLAVIEYNYERDGEIVVPSGAKAIGHVRDANRSGYVDIQFDSLWMPDGTSVPIEAVATDLNLRPLKGKVEGKNTGKNLLVRSLSGIGQAGSMLLGQRSFNGALSESDLMRQRVSSNIGEAGDEEVSRLAMTQHIVVTVSAGLPIYVILEQAPKANQALPQYPPRTAPTSNSAEVEQLRQVLSSQQELNPPEPSAP